MTRSAPVAFDWDSGLTALLVIASTLWFGAVSAVFLSMMDLACNRGHARRSSSLLRLCSRLRMETVSKANDGIQTAVDESPQKPSMTRCRRAVSPENKYQLPPPAARKTENLPPS